MTAATLLHLSMNATVESSTASSVGQSGGQVANIIANYLGGEAGSTGLSSKLREREAEILAEAWDVFQKAYGAVWDATSPLQQFPDLGRMSPPQLEDFLRQIDLPEYQKSELSEAPDKFKAFSEINFWRKLSFAASKRAEFQNLLVKNRIFIREPIKSLLSEINGVMSDALIKLEIGKSADVRMWAEASRMVRSLDSKINELERQISDRLHGGT